MTTMKDIQERLKREGFYFGEIDGIKGPQTTEAVRRYQEFKKLPIQFPGTIGPITLKSLFPDGNVDPQLQDVSVAAPWLSLIIQKKGLHEETNYDELSKFLKSDGKTLGDPRRLPWCGDLVQTALALTLPTEPMVVNPYLARNWLKFGVSSPLTRGAIVIFWRGSRNGMQGHIGVVAGIDPSDRDQKIYVAGGNQKDRISIVPFDPDRVLGYRWPKTYPPSEVFLPSMKGGVLSINEA